MELPNLVHRIATDPTFADWFAQQIKLGEVAELNLDGEAIAALRTIVTRKSGSASDNSARLNSDPTAEWYAPSLLSPFSPA